MAKKQRMFIILCHKVNADQNNVESLSYNLTPSRMAESINEMTAHAGEDVEYRKYSSIAGGTAITMEISVVVPQEDGNRSPSRYITLG